MKGYKIGFSEITKVSLPFLCYALIELEVPEKYPGAKIYSFRSKNRTNVARVLRINGLNINPKTYTEPVEAVSFGQLDSAFSIFDHNFYYHPGEIVYPDCFDEQTTTCSNGIHFFTYRQEAIDYVMNDCVIDKMRSCIAKRKEPTFELR